MKSMRRFIADKHPPFGLRCSLENFSEHNDIRTLPLFALEQLRENNLNWHGLVK